MTLNTKTLLIGLCLLVLGLALGAGVAENWSSLHRLITLSADNSTPPPKTPPTADPCRKKIFPNLGLALCLPGNWIIKDNEGPLRTQRGKIIAQSPDYSAITDTTPQGLPQISIQGGAQLSVSVNRLTLESTINTYSDLKSFWQTNNTNLAREEEYRLDGTPALYDVLASPKEGNQIQVHFLNRSLIYDFNYYFNASSDPTGEDRLHQILNSLSFTDVDPLFYPNSAKINLAASPSANPLPPNQPLTLTVTLHNLRLDSQGELPTLVRRTFGGPPVVLGTAIPASASAGIASADSFSFTWLLPDYGSHQISAQIIKNSGEIYQSAPINVVVGSSVQPKFSTPEPASAPGKYP